MQTSGFIKKRGILLLIVAAIVLELTTALQFYSMRRGITERLTEMAQQDLSDANLTARKKRNVEAAIEALMPEMERMAQRGQTDSLKDAINRTVASHKEIVGIDFCFVEEEGKQREAFYLYKEDGTDKLREHSIDFDFTQRSWYIHGIESDGFWSEPYMSNYKVILMSTYSRRVCDRHGNTIAVVGADVPMRELSSLASQLFENQESTLPLIIMLHLFGLAVLAFIIRWSVRSQRKLEAANIEKERIGSELNIARNIQLAMLPKTFPPFPERDDINIYSLLTPAREVGGDFYDFFIRNEKLFLCVGDVSGKGVPAALVMAVARSTFRMLSEHESSPERIVSQMNDTMARDNDYNMFITLFVGVLDLPTGRLRYTNAGHKAPVIVCGKESLEKSLLPVDPNLPIGAFPDWKYSLQETTICNGTTLFLYTDGLTEAEDAGHNLFGQKRLMDNIIQVDAEALICHMEDAVKMFVGKTEQSDDLTMMAIQYSHRQADEHSHRTIILPCDIGKIPDLGVFVGSICKEAGLGSTATMQTNMALEEAVVNVMSYAYPKGTEGDVRIDAYANSERLKFVITDSGKAFDPTTYGTVDTSLPAEERSIGGLGIHIMRSYMDSINYERMEGQNILTLRKQIGNKN